MPIITRPVPTPDSAASLLAHWQGGHESLKQEFEYWIDDIDGTIPADLNGTLFRNGPGLLDVNGHRLQHPFDGDGMICAFTFDHGRAHFRNRFVRTEGFVAEQAAGKILYRGVFGTQKPGGWMANAFDLRIKNIANTNVIFWGGKLLALWEAAPPYRLDPSSLETLGPEDLGGLLSPDTPFSAHPIVAPGHQYQDPRLINFSIQTGLSSKITVYEFNLEGQAIQERQFTIPGFAFIHDFVVTPSYYIFFQNPVTLNPLPYVLGLKGAGECLIFQNRQPTQIWLVPRDSSAPIQSFHTHAGFVFHHANAYEQDHTLIIDSVCYPTFPALDPSTDYRSIDFKRIPAGELWRIQLDRTAQTVQQQCLTAHPCEFPTIHPNHVGRPYRYLYIGATHTATENAPLQAILKLDLDKGEQDFWSAAPHGFGGEPIFVPKAIAETEDAGWLLMMVYNSQTHRSELVILDGEDLCSGPVACLHLKHHVPYGLHGSFIPTVFAT